MYFTGNGNGSNRRLDAELFFHTRIYGFSRSACAFTNLQVACSQPFAADAGLRILRAGGNAADAAVAIAACMQVCEPCSTGLGGDAFALYYDATTRKVSGLNGSGACAASLTLETAVSLSGESAPHLPERHASTVTVPGAAAAWCDALERWGTQSLATVLAPAIALAKDGFPVSPITSHHWREGAHWLREAKSSGALLVDGERGPYPGEVFVNSDLASVLRELVAGGKKAFYHGRVAAAISEAVQSRGGFLDLSDLASHVTDFVEPISTCFAGKRVWELPPNGQGTAYRLV